MKLYATVTSERASKGQGGQEYIATHFNVNRVPIGNVLLVYKNDTKEHGMDLDEWVLQYQESEDDDWQIIAQGNVEPQTKGEKKKGKTCMNCGEVFDTLISFEDATGKKLNLCHDCAEGTT